MSRRIFNRMQTLRKRVGYWIAIKTNRSSADPLTASYEWISKPGPVIGKNVCVLVSWSPEPRLSEHALLLAKSWAAIGFCVIVVIVKNFLDDFDRAQDLSFCDGILIRENLGYDFGAWASAIRLLPDVNEARLLVLANDSVFGPLANFETFVDRMAGVPADVVGAIASRQNIPHIQSFLLMFKPKVLRSTAFFGFWNNIRNGDREWAIRNYELPLQRYFLSAGFSVDALYKAPMNLPDDTNPALTIWRELVDGGFPFVKVQLLRDNPIKADLSDWQSFLEEHDYDPAIVKRYLYRISAIKP